MERSPTALTAVGYAAADPTIIFSIDDFDEPLPGPFEWTLNCLAECLA